MKSMLEKSLYVTVSHCGADGAMTVDRLLEFFQDLASQHGEMIGVGLEDMTRKQRFWLTVRSRVRVFRAPRLGETVTGTTWPAPPNGLRCDRFYTVHGADGALLADGRTEWAVFDTAAGRVASPKGIFPENLEYRAGTAGGEGFRRLPTDFADVPELRAYTVPSTDIDVGRHLNNVAYSRILLGAFPVAQRLKQPVTELELCYRQPCFEGETLSVRARAGEGCTELAILRPDGAAALLGRMVTAHDGN